MITTESGKEYIISYKAHTIGIDSESTGLYSLAVISQDDYEAESLKEYFLLLDGVVTPYLSTFFFVEIGSFEEWIRKNIQEVVNGKAEERNISGNICELVIKNTDTTIAQARTSSEEFKPVCRYCIVRQIGNVLFYNILDNILIAGDPCLAFE